MCDFGTAKWVNTSEARSSLGPAHRRHTASESDLTESSEPHESIHKFFRKRVSDASAHYCRALHDHGTVRFTRVLFCGVDRLALQEPACSPYLWKLEACLLSSSCQIERLTAASDTQTFIFPRIRHCETGRTTVELLVTRSC